MGDNRGRYDLTTPSYDTIASAKRECHLHKKSYAIKVHSNELNGIILGHLIEGESNNLLGTSDNGSMRNCNLQI